MNLKIKRILLKIRRSSTRARRYRLSRLRLPRHGGFMCTPKHEIMGAAGMSVALRDCCGHRTLLAEKLRWPDGRKGGRALLFAFPSFPQGQGDSAGAFASRLSEPSGAVAFGGSPDGGRGNALYGVGVSSHLRSLPTVSPLRWRADCKSISMACLL